jgi:peptidoglycan/xylan/chitin deacetylase (PgdA/CDA1 family)
MTWDDVRLLRRAGMDVQSHTRTHRVLQTLGEAELRTELVGSREDLEQQLETPVCAISYPVGRRLGERIDIRRQLESAGYRLGFTNDTGIHRIRRSIDPFDVSRVGLEYGTSTALFRAMLAVPGVFE